MYGRKDVHDEQRSGRPLVFGWNNCKSGARNVWRYACDSSWAVQTDPWTCATWWESSMTRVYRNCHSACKSKSIATVIMLKNSMFHSLWQCDVAEGLLQGPCYSRSNSYRGESVRVAGGVWRQRIQRVVWPALGWQYTLHIGHRAALCKQGCQQSCGGREDDERSLGGRQHCKVSYIEYTLRRYNQYSTLIPGLIN